MLAVVLVVLGAAVLLLAVRQRQNGRGSVSLGLTVGGFVLMTAALALALRDAGSVAADHQAPPAQTPTRP